MTTVAGLSHGEKRHVDDRDAVGQCCFRREGQGQVPFGGSRHGAFICGGDFNALGGWPFMEEIEQFISEVDGASVVCNDAVVVVNEELEGIGTGDGGR